MDKENLIQKIKKSGLSNTNPRLEVLKILNNVNGPLSIENIIRNSKKRIAISTLYRVIADLLDAKLIKTFSSPDQKLLIEMTENENTNEHHHHLYCKSCEKVFDINLDNKVEAIIEKLVNQISQTHQIEINEHSFEMYGSCNNEGKHPNIENKNRKN
jgi:Fe2+ or Zn2+ uptake regulation protein